MNCPITLGSAVTRTGFDTKLCQADAFLLVEKRFLL